jgi:cytochrome c5
MSSPLGALLLMALASAPAPAAAPSPYIEFQGLHLAQGRAVWLGTCEGCHGYGTAGAPIPMEPSEWQPRLQQPIPVLYRHAIKGFFGPDDTYMPPRGGNSELSDAQVRAAVDYMVRLAHHYIETERK